MPGIELEDIMMGISVCRNQNLANVFYRLHLIEAYGTGIGKIMKAYEEVEVKPIIENTKNAFKIILPNVNSKYEKRDAVSLQPETNTEPVGTNKSLSDEDKLMQYTRLQGGNYTK